MRTAILAAALVSLAAPLASADAPPEGTIKLKMVEGETQSLNARNGSQVVCDDPGVAHADVKNDQLVLVAGHAGETLCGVRFDGANRGVYLVTVTVPSKK